MNSVLFTIYVSSKYLIRRDDKKKDKGGEWMKHYPSTEHKKEILRNKVHKSSESF